MPDTSLEDAVRPGDPCVMVVFGGTGDLSRRKLFPALYHLRKNGFLSGNMAVVGVSKDPMTDESYRELVDGAMRQFAEGFDPEVWEPLHQRFYYVQGAFDDPATFQKLKERLDQIHAEDHCGGNTLFYLAVPPTLFALVPEQLSKVGLIQPPDGPAWSRVIVEKPFGTDLNSARELNRRLLNVLDESQIYRIDHYLGKETVQNLLIFRFVNGIFEPIWNRRYVDHVQILVAEEVGVERRGGYYEGAGALRDMVQNHMFQVLSLVAMEPPIALDGECVRDEKVKVLKAMHPMNAEMVCNCSVRGQYTAGEMDGKPVPGYREEPDVSPQSITETYVALKLFVENWRWADVPFYLRTGKRLQLRDTEITIQFRRAPLMLLPGNAGKTVRPNRLTIHIQPDERITWRFEVKRPGPLVRVTEVEMVFRYSDLPGTSPGTGYETLLYDAMIGDATLFHRNDMVEAAWKVATPILDAWKAQDVKELPGYPAGSWGPKEADEMIQADGREWAEPS